ncbi:hypothetical protein QFZ52_000021 [Arthrobacter woluwensis]|uniref:hypothetical protein n=1 Tax=Arthrobacter woluwensis TaxID=156980 RepID=UPI00277E7C08|nr:hypothetical protein [Arthrobacter woluwensis]MDQ0707369.1 hypothetical protein [Arthrobacter woluwensis]
MLLFHNVSHPISGKPMLLEVEGTDYQDAYGKLQQRLRDLAHATTHVAAVSTGGSRRTSLARYVEPEAVDTPGMPQCACCFHTA